jgi:fructose-1,6-bisphosphatase/inositol monophosphatase family enzyme
MIKTVPNIQPILKIVKTAGKTLLEYFNNVTAEQKADGSLVTIADVVVEDILVNGLKQIFPKFSIISEEGATYSSNESKYTWFIDPLDGTSAFIEGLSYWGISLSLSDGSDFVFGLTHFPRVNETYFSHKDSYLTKNNEKIVYSKQDIDRNSVLYVPSTIHKYAKINWPGKLRSLGSISGHLSLLAGGSAYGVIVPRGWKLWDIGAGLVFTRNVGLISCIHSGQPFDPFSHKESSFIVGNKYVMDWLNSHESIQFY